MFLGAPPVEVIVFRTLVFCPWLAPYFFGMNPWGLPLLYAQTLQSMIDQPHHWFPLAGAWEDRGPST